MPHSRRRILSLGLGAISAATVGARGARSQSYPTRPVRLLVGFAAGSIVDVFARLMGQWLSDHLGQPYFIENRVGAVGNLATKDAVSAPPDGYTLLLITTVNVINASLYQNLSFNFVEDIAPVASFYRDGPAVIVVNPSFPARSVPEFIAYAKANPGQVVMASAGNGSPQHVYGELFKMMAGVDLLHVPYRSGVQALTDLMSGQVQVIFDPLADSIEHVKAGRLRALAVTTASRLAILPDVPTVSEFVSGYQATGWMGIGVPRTTPHEIIEALNREINAGLFDSRVRERFAGLGGYTPFAASPEDFATFISAEAEKWARVVKFSGATVG